MILLLCLVCLAGAKRCCAQDKALAATLAHLADLAAAEKTQIPSFECTETGVSTVLHGDRVKKRVTFTATIQAKRNAEGSLDETFRVHMLDGQPYDKEKVSLPLYVKGGFSDALSSFKAGMDECVTYSMSPGRVDFSAKANVEKINADKNDGCHVGEGAVGFALFDADGNVTHVEHRVPKETAYKHQIATYSSLDLKPVELNARIYWLTANAVGEIPHGSDLLHFEAMYSLCHRYTSTVTLGPANIVPPDEPGAAQPK